MGTYRDILEEAKCIFKEKGIFEYESNAWLLFEEAFSMTKLSYLLDSGKEAPQKAQEKYKSYIDRRISGEPVQYIIGKTEFMGLEFEVNENVLIPRFDTEVLVNRALQSINEGDEVLDMCTGSGCIIISLAKYSKGKTFTGVDISAGALQVAAKNAGRHNVQVNYIKSDLFRDVSGKYDVIVSNPPYISDDEIETLEEEVKLREPRLALSGGADGLDFYKRIVCDAKVYLKPKGRLMFEIGCDQGEAVSLLMKEMGYEHIEVIKDLAGLDRVVVGGI